MLRLLPEARSPRPRDTVPLSPLPRQAVEAQQGVRLAGLPLPGQHCRRGTQSVCLRRSQERSG